MTNSTVPVSPVLSAHRDVALSMIAEYQQKRIEWYEKQKLKDMLRKDITMFVARGCTTPSEYLAEAFRAIESSSEETVMGSLWQRILASISEDTLDMGDLTTVRDGVLWVLELKSQTNTTNSSSLPQELRSLRTRMEEVEGRRRASRQPVKAALCVARDGRVGKDQTLVYASSTLQRENRDLDGFEYRYLTEPKFWQWLAGYDSEIGLLMPLSDIDGSTVKASREACLTRLTGELAQQLYVNKLGSSINDLVLLRDILT
ncbi:PmeII family type II restriction endonuclease [Arthrobacter psychrolactophilus]